MSKRVFVVSDPVRGVKKVFPGLREASEWSGLSVGSLSRGVRDGGKAGGMLVRWADRVFAVREGADGPWTVAMEDSRGRYYVELCGERRIRKGGAVQVRELTGEWYY